MIYNILRNLSLILALVFCTGVQTNAQDTYSWSDELELLRRIDKLPEYRHDSYVEQFSSYDRTWGNDDGFKGTYSFIRKEGDRLVIAEMIGPGVINRIYTPTPTDNMLFFYFDGETEPGLAIKFSDLFSGNVYPFLKPICGNEIGGYYCYLPITYKKSCKVVLDGPKLEFIQIQYRDLPGKNVETFDGDRARQYQRQLEEVNTMWSNINPEVSDFLDGKSRNVKEYETSFTLNPGDEKSFFKMKKAGRIVGLVIDGGSSFEGTNKDVLLSATWDNEDVEAIYAPVADFFGYAFGKGAMRSMLMGRNRRHNYCYFPMPFDKSVTASLIYKRRDGVEQLPIHVTVKVYYNTNGRNPGEEGKFYSAWRREVPEEGRFYTFLDLKGKGHYVGTIHQAQGLNSGMTSFFEGDDSTWVDKKMRLHGTGSEDYYNGGWYAMLDRWDRGNSLPIHGCLDYSLPMARTGGYRFYITDKLSFEEEIYHGIEHGYVRNNVPVDYTSLAFLYAGQPLKYKMEPSDEKRVVYYPKEHMYYPDLMQITPGAGMQIIFDRWIRMMTKDKGEVRIMLNDVPEGKYKVLINYIAKPNGAEFQVWHRQKKVSDWMSARSDKDERKDKVSVGEIELTEQTNSITFRIKKSETGDELHLRNIILQRVD